MDMNSMNGIGLNPYAYLKNNSNATADRNNFISEVQKVLEGKNPTGTAGVSQAQSVSLEERLKAKYPGLVYHVFDGSSGYWRTRNDYPHYLLYNENLDVEALENWSPKGPNPAYMESKEIRAMGSIPPGSKAVVIHPSVQERMEQDPEYADEIMERIETWFAFDLARNEAIMPGCSMELSQSVVIGEDGCIANAVTSGPPRLTYSKSGPDDGRPGFWEARVIRHDYYMQIQRQEQIEHGMEVSQQLNAWSLAQSAKSRLAEMMQGDTLKTIFGETIGGMPTDMVLAETRKQVWGTASL